MVAGNNDFFSDEPKEELIHIGNYSIFLTHGHRYNVYSDLTNLKQVGRQLGADIVMYGHTHKPDIDLSDDIIAINPGSLSYPRQAGRVPSYIVMEIDRNGEVKFVLKYVQ